MVRGVDVSGKYLYNKVKNLAAGKKVGNQWCKVNQLNSSCSDNGITNWKEI